MTVHLTVSNYRGDKYYPRVVAAVGRILERSKVVTPADLFIEMGVLTRENYEAWRRGRVPFLEKVINMNLSSTGRVLRLLRFHAHDLNMKRSMTVYVGWKGAGHKKSLQFSKTGDENVEKAYSEHFVYTGNKTSGFSNNQSSDEEMSS